MSDTILVKGWADKGHEGGVLIDAADFDPAIHKKFDEPDAPKNEFLDRTAAKILEDLEALNKDELTEYLAAEKSGKNRDGVVKAIEKELSK